MIISNRSALSEDGNKSWSFIFIIFDFSAKKALPGYTISISCDDARVNLTFSFKWILFVASGSKFFILLNA
jgi:hypothetical protein